MTWKMVLASFRTLIVLTSPEFRKILVDLMKSLYQKAQNTENPFDDWLVEFVCQLMAIDIEAVMKKEAE